MSNLLGLIPGFLSSAPSTSQQALVIVAYVLFIGGMLYLMAIKPQKKQQRKHDALMSELEVGASILTTSGFYGVVIDIMDEIVIVEFGNNKNCRIPMKKEAIVEIEKANKEKA